MTEFRLISIPPFIAVHSDVDRQFDFSSRSPLGKFNDFFSRIEPSIRDQFTPRDFLFFDEEKQGLVWMYALAPGMNPHGFSTFDFDGGMYLTYVYRDGDDKTNGKLYQKALDYIASSEVIELDKRPNHYPMGHIITPPALIKKQGWAQMETFIPIKLKGSL